MFYEQHPRACVYVCTCAVYVHTYVCVCMFSGTKLHNSLYLVLGLQDKVEDNYVELTVLHLICFFPVSYCASNCIQQCLVSWCTQRHLLCPSFWVYSVKVLFNVIARGSLKDEGCCAHAVHQNTQIRFVRVAERDKTGRLGGLVQAHRRGVGSSEVRKARLAAQRESYRRACMSS